MRRTRAGEDLRDTEGAVAIKRKKLTLRVKTHKSLFYSPFDEVG
jgi:hypothetical protein